MAVAVVQCTNNVAQILASLRLSGKNWCVIVPIFIWGPCVMAKRNQQVFLSVPFTSVHIFECRPGALLAAGKGEDSQKDIISRCFQSIEGYK